MKKVRSEIVKYMSGLEPAKGTITSRFLFPDSFIGFQGHFTDKKVLPGVCEIQCALSSVERATGSRAVLKEVVLAKYFSPVGPNEEIVCVTSDVKEGGEFTFKTVITKGTTKVAELKLKVVLVGQDKDR